MEEDGLAALSPGPHASMHQLLQCSSALTSLTMNGSISPEEQHGFLYWPGPATPQTNPPKGWRWLEKTASLARPSSKRRWHCSWALTKMSPQRSQQEHEDPSVHLSYPDTRMDRVLKARSPGKTGHTNHLIVWLFT